MAAQVKSVQKYARGSCRIITDKGDWMAFAESGSVKRLAQWLQAGISSKDTALSQMLALYILKN